MMKTEKMVKFRPPHFGWSTMDGLKSVPLNMLTKKAAATKKVHMR